MDEVPERRCEVGQGRGKRCLGRMGGKERGNVMLCFEVWFEMWIQSKYMRFVVIVV